MAVKKTKEDTLGPAPKPNEIYKEDEFCPVCGKHVSENCEHIRQVEEEVENEIGKKVDEESIDPVLDAFANLENAPTDAQIQEWKKTFKKIFLTMLDDDFGVVYRKLTRGEYKKLAARKMEQIALEEEIYRLCVLWPRSASMTIAEIDAGVVSTVATMVLRVSGFVSEQEALMFTREL